MPVKKDQFILLSFFQFSRGKSIWAMKQMGVRPPLVDKIEEISFHKMLGSGGGGGYGFWPDFRTYALLTVWDDISLADKFEAGSETMSDFRAHAEEIYSIFMQPVQSRGVWSGKEPFQDTSKLGEDDKVAVITRATLKPGFIIPFWRRVRGVSDSQAGAEGLLFSKGIGERPWVMQATFTIWENLKSMQKFAYSSDSKHSKAIAITKQKKGFREEMYARFKVIETRGSWRGNDPVKNSG